MQVKAIQKIVEAILAKSQTRIELGIILGTGLHDFVNYIKSQIIISYNELEGLPEPSVVSHEGKIIIGIFEGKNVLCFLGRFHYYEGFTMQQVVLPVRVLQFLKCENIWITNAAGSINPTYNLGDIMVLNDHINLQSDNPLRGKSPIEFGARFPDMLGAYCQNWIKNAKRIATENNVVLHEGVYAAVNGPNLETPAEYKMLFVLGADVVGMSTVPEVIVAKQAGMRIAVFSIITDVCYPIERLRETTLDAIIKVAKDTEPKLLKILTKLIHEV